MYNFADSSVTASAFTSGANTALTLVATTAGLTTTAALVIYYDDQVAGISGTVTANVVGTNTTAKIPLNMAYADETFTNGNRLAVSIVNSEGEEYSTPLPVNINSQFYNEPSSKYAIRSSAAFIDGGDLYDVTTLDPLPVSIYDSNGQSYGSSANPLKVSGTVTIGAGTAQIGSVTVGNSVTIGSLPAISGTVTANLAISSSAITSGSFTSLSSATLVPANTARKMATVYNLGAGQLFINAGASATTLGGGFMVALSSGDFYECNYTTTTLSAIFATAGTASWMSH
jgi:hypothetical protein